MKSFKEYLEEKSPCWKGYEQFGMKKKGDKKVPNCIPVKEEEEPAIGDGFVFELHDTDIESTTIEFTEDGIVVELDDLAMDVIGECYLMEAEYKGRQVPLNKPMKGDVKKSKVYVKGPSGKVVKVEFGDPNMTIKKHIPARRKSFRARHRCDSPGPKHKARYWSCRAW